MSALRSGLVLVILCVTAVLFIAVAWKHQQPDASAAGILVAGFGLSSFCILAYRKSR